MRYMKLNGKMQMFATSKMKKTRELGKGKGGMLLFRHPKGYKETFLKTSIGNDIEVREVKR